MKTKWSKNYVPQTLGQARPRYRTEAFQDEVRVPPVQLNITGYQSGTVPSATLDGLRSAGDLVKVVNPNGGVSWYVEFHTGAGK